MVVRTCDIKLIFINYSQSNAVNASYLTDFVQICLFTSLKSKMCLLFPLEFTETERGLVTKGTSYCSEIKPASIKSFISPLTNVSFCKADILFLGNIPFGRE